MLAPTMGRIRWSTHVGPLLLASVLASRHVDAQDAPQTAVVDDVAVDDVAVDDDATVDDDDELPTFGARAVVREQAPDVVATSASQLRDQPGSLGDPLRALDTVPGVLPAASGLPFFFVRGAPPSGTLFVYDGIPLPALFHLGAGPAVVHPRMLGELRLHTGAAPARHGRYVGAVVEVDPASSEVSRPRGELELRTLDLNGWVETPLGDEARPVGALQAAGRLGWPGFLLEPIVGAQVFYGDAQLRARIDLSSRDRLELVMLGSADRLAFLLPDRTQSLTEVIFQRTELRLIRALGRGAELGIALRGGYDRSTLTGTTALGDPDNPLQLRMEAGVLGVRTWGRFREGVVSGHVGVELQGQIGRPNAQLETLPEIPLQADRLFVDSASRATASAFVDLAWQLDRRVVLRTGVRTDQWKVGPRLEGAIDPRIALDVQVDDHLELHASAGVARQPRVFYLPFPGLAEAPVQGGLQTAIQGEIGARYRHDWLDVIAQLYVQRYQGVVLADASLLIDASANACAWQGGGCLPVNAPSSVDGLSYGGEIMARVAATEPFSGTLSYSLAWNDVDDVLGLPYRPSYDIRHSLSGVFVWNPGGGFTAGVRVFVRSGATHGRYYAGLSDRLEPELRRYERELDAFGRLDAQVSYAWDAGWARLRLSLEWVNVTLSEEPIAMECSDYPRTAPSDGTCGPLLAPPIFVPNLGIRGEFR